MNQPDNTKKEILEEFDLNQGAPFMATSDARSTEKRVREELQMGRLLEALALMYDQYCSSDGHLFMTAGEITSSLLEQYGVLDPDEAGRGEIRWELINALLQSNQEPQQENNGVA
jgi:hypothetical protein